MATIITLQASDQITNSRADINTSLANLNADKIETSYLDTDTTLAANSDSKIATQKAVKAYADALGGLATSTSGVSAGPASTSTQTITHSLGRVPKIIRIYGHGRHKGSTQSVSSGMSTGTYNSTGNRCAYVTSGTEGNDQTAGTSTTYAVRLGGQTVATAEVNATGVIQNVTSTTFDIAWTASADTSAVTFFLWEAI